MFDMIGKMQEMKKKAEETKQRLDKITIQGQSSGGEVIVTSTGNRRITNISIAYNASLNDKEQLEDFLLVAINRALESADKVNETEMQSVAKGMLPGFPGLG